LLEAPAITIDGTLAVNGGGGGGGRVSNGGTGTVGEHGTLDRSIAEGGEGDMEGGAGAAGDTPDGERGEQASGVGGGGGGGIGWIRINTKTGSATIGTQAVLSPNFDDENTTCTQGQAAVQ
jgi:hypothetical protein